MLPVAVKIVKRFDRYLFKKWRSSGGAYGYVDMGGWIGGQSRIRDGALCRFNLLKFLKTSHGKDIRSNYADILPNRSGGRCEGWFSRIYVQGQ
jgi:hypothetical protein